MHMCRACWSWTLLKGKPVLSSLENCNQIVVKSRHGKDVGGERKTPKARFLPPVIRTKLIWFCLNDAALFLLLCSMLPTPHPRHPPALPASAPSWSDLLPPVNLCPLRLISASSEILQRLHSTSTDAFSKLL